MRKSAEAWWAQLTEPDAPRADHCRRHGRAFCQPRSREVTKEVLLVALLRRP
jgi:hypothetical protein